MTATLPIKPSHHSEELLVRADRAAITATLARGMAHDLRGSLQAFTLLADPSVDLLSGPEAGPLRGIVSKAVERLGGTISRFSQAFAPVETEPGPLIVAEILGQVTELQRYQRGLPDAELECQVPAGLPPVRGVETQLRHLLLSLVINAKQALAGRTGGRIILGARMDDARVRLVVEDNGPGLGAADRVRAFEPFYTTREGGMGIGLTVARWLAERQGGTVGLEDAPGSGLKAVVTLPAWSRE